MLHRHDPTLTAADLARVFAEEQSWTRAARRLGTWRVDELRALVERRYRSATGHVSPPPWGADGSAWERYRRAVDEWFAGQAGAPDEEVGAG